MDKGQGFMKNLLYIVFVFSLTFLFGLVIKLEINILDQIIIISMVSMLVKLFIFHPLILYGLIAIIFVLALTINRYYLPIIPPFIERTYSLLSNIIENLKGNERIATENILIFWIMLILVVALYTAIVLFKNKSIYLLPPIYLGIFLYYWYTFIDQAYWMIFIFVAAFVILLGLTKYFLEKENVDETRTNALERLYSPWIKTAINYSMLIVVVALILPKSNSHLKWGYLQQKVYTYFPFVEDLRSYDIYSKKAEIASLFDFSKTGFQGETSRLGGPVVLSDKKVMTVEGNNVNYLRGNIKHIYNGNIWWQETIDSRNYSLMQNFSSISDEERKLYFTVSDLLITNHNFASTTIFSPLLPESININKDSFVNVNNDFSLTLLQGVYENESYFVRTIRPLPYGKLVYLGIDNKKDDIAGIEKYLQLPNEKITIRTRNLVKELTMNKQNDFEKAVAIEDYLRKNFKYSLNVKIVPENREFVDYFLFEEKEGYCTYYATSMAIMLRLADIPSRYVEGYLVQNSVGDGVYEVRQENAHAWVEAFIEPVGWMTFEATPEFPIESRLEGYQPVKVSSGSQNNDIIDNDRRDKFKEDLFDESYPDIEVGDWDIVVDDNGDITTNIFNHILIITVGILLSIIPIRVIVGVVLYSYREYKSKKLSNNNRIIYLYNQIAKLIGLLDSPQQNGETHNEYARRVAYKFYDHDKVGIIELTEIFVRSKYSKIPASIEEVFALEEYRNKLEKRAKSQLGRGVYYFNKFVI